MQEAANSRLNTLIQKASGFLVDLKIIKQRFIGRCTFEFTGFQQNSCKKKTKKRKI